MHPRRRDVRGPAGLAGPHRASSGPAPAQTVRVDTDRAEDAAEVLPRAGPDRRRARSTATGQRPLGEVAVEKIVPDLVHAGVPVLGFAVQRPAWRTCSSR